MAIRVRNTTMWKDESNNPIPEGMATELHYIYYYSELGHIGVMEIAVVYL